MEAINALLEGSDVDAISVLLVDENPTFLRITSRVLREYYADELIVVGMSSGNEDSIDQARRLKPRIILLGFDQYNGLGLSLIARLHAALPDVKIIVLGQFDMYACQQAAFDAGADGFVARTALSNDLMPTIQKVAGQKVASATGGSATFKMPVRIPMPLFNLDKLAIS